MQVARFKTGFAECKLGESRKFSSCTLRGRARGRDCGRKFFATGDGGQGLVVQRVDGGAGRQGHIADQRAVEDRDLVGDQAGGVKILATVWLNLSTIGRADRERSSARSFQRAGGALLRLNRYLLYWVSQKGHRRPPPKSLNP